MMSTQVKRGMRAMAIKEETKSTIKEGQVLDLIQLVEYGEGAVVSRTLIENNAATVILFAFDTDQGVSEWFCSPCLGPFRVRLFFLHSLNTDGGDRDQKAYSGAQIAFAVYHAASGTPGSHNCSPALPFSRGAFTADLARQGT